MALATSCQTTGAIFHSNITSDFVSVGASLPMVLELTETQALELETNLHNALELVLARYWSW